MFNNSYYRHLAAFSLLLIAFGGYAQDGSHSLSNIVRQGELHGNFQAEAQFYNKDTLIGAEQPDEQLLMNGFANFTYTNGRITAGLRYESYQNALLGFPEGYKGNGIPYRYLGYTDDVLSFTVGNFYEQFGNGLVLRTYEERGLGYDNVMDGIRVTYKLHEGVYLKGVIGQQRKFFDLGEGIVRGIDGEFEMAELFPSLADDKGRLTLGGSFVSKYQPDNNPDLILPENVGSWAGRFRYRRGKVTVSGEFAHKINDPSFDNGYIYKDGNSALLQTSYSRKGLGIALSAKRVDNMSFRSERDEELSNVLINYIPSLTRQHTYNLLATLYPYATQLNGEMAFQGDLTYKLKKKTFLGGKYGTTVAVNYSLVNDIDRQAMPDPDSARKGYTSDFFKVGDRKFWREFNVEITKRFSKKFKGVFDYSYIENNQDVLVKTGLDYVYASIAVADVTYKFNSNNSLRTELQGLWTQNDQGDWATLLFEYTIHRKWFVALLDQYNYGNSNEDLQTHYYNASGGYKHKGTAVTMSYGRQRAGIFCVGGVCRTVPSSNGLYLSITSTF